MESTPTDTSSKPILSRIVAAFLGFAAVIAAIYGFAAYIDWRVERTVSSEAFLRRLSDTVRPSCIFDQKGSIIVDMGAMNHIESIDVMPSSEKEELPPKIVVHPKHYLSHAPLLSTLDPYTLIVSTERGTKFDWVYTLSYVGQYNSDWKSIRYRVEILY